MLTGMLMGLLLASFEAAAAEDGIFDGVYFGVRLGPLLPHDADERFLASSNGVARDDVLVERDAQTTGFAINVAFGARLDPDWPVWLRSEMELGWQRYAVKAGSGGSGASTAISVLWHNYFHPFDKQNPHQIWGGLGFGGSFGDTKLPNGSGTAESGGVNFITMASVGYDYLVLERSRFSSEHLLLGVSYRFLVAEGYSEELGSQVLINMTYGF